MKKFKALIAEAAVLQEEVQKTFVIAKRKLKKFNGSRQGLEVSQASKAKEQNGKEEDESEESDLDCGDKKAFVTALTQLEHDWELLAEICSDPEKKSVFMRFIVGKIQLKQFFEKDKLTLRDEYNKFRVRAAMIYVLFPLVVLFFHYYLRFVWKDTHWINVFFQLWVLYYYISMAVRENTLAENGSNIKNWWIYHHYLAAMATVVLLVWPATSLYEAYVPYLTTFAFYNGIVMNVQNYYHKTREYANRALGNIKNLDITYPETITEVPKELLVLLPFLFIAQVWEIWLGLSLLKTFLFQTNVEKSWTEYREELQIFSTGVLQLTMGVGNMVVTIQTIQKKRNHSTRRAKKHV